MDIDLFNYDLPLQLIAQEPAKPRDHSRLLVFDRETNTMEHRHFYDLLEYLSRDDVLVVNQTKVIPARLLGRKTSGGYVEVFLTARTSPDSWQVMIGGRGLKIGAVIKLPQRLEAKITKRLDDKLWEVKFNVSGTKLSKLFDEIGQTPLPPYIKTPDSDIIKERYQTVYAQTKGAVAAPTAGLHFSHALLEKLKAKGVAVYSITLHVGLGTFQPVTVSDISKHKIHSERVIIDKQTAAALNEAKSQGKNIIAVGTTTTRALEAFANDKHQLKAGDHDVDIYIYPGYKYKFVDQLITNFHLPKSSLLFMVAALVGRKTILEIYDRAMQMQYRFFSFGDAMFIR